MYHLDSTWAVRANFATGFRRPSMYARTNTYFIVNIGDGTIQRLAGVRRRDGKNTRVGSRFALH